MGLLDKLFSKKINKKANEIIKSLNNNIKRSAYYSGGMNGGAKMPHGLSASGRTVYINHYEMRQNARDAYHDSMDARTIIERIADMVIDTGLKLESTPDFITLGITSEEAQKWGTNIDRRFHLWANNKKQHRSRIMNFYQFQRLYEIQQQRDNDIFVRLYYSNKKELQNPLQYEFIDANQIRGNAWTSTYSQFSYEDGIIRNPDGSERAYKIWFRDKNENGKYKNIDVPVKGPKSGKTMMLHGFNPEYAGQGRGYSRLGFAIQELENLTNFTLAAINKATNQSNMVFSVENQQQDPGNPLEEITVPGKTVMGQSLSKECEDILEDISKVPAICPLPEAGVEVQGSMSFVGNQQGDNIKLLDTKAPADNFREFIMTFVERFSAATGFAQEAIYMKFSSSYSAARAALLITWKAVEMWRQEISIDFLNPIFNSWLSEEIAAGRIIAPGFLDPILKAAWLSCSWIGSPLPSIDPARESKARKENLEMNLTTGERESRALNGSDFKANIEKNKKSFSEMPLPPWSSSNFESEESDDMEEEDK